MITLIMLAYIARAHLIKTQQSVVYAEFVRFGFSMALCEWAVIAVWILEKLNV